ncbi:MAG: FAD-dependent oxidoreductase [Melioribacteraceae bacterium]|nr:FAD-dependent oxidoreductase [Melioribacteraceae bacterium]MCF8265928.1 FAD-dependent oxidoreductase [Melioribacteraceae bacterium]MCF8297958.1 FAD-dependent oxidoreductase [Saprospiraceae bacterium]
MSLIKKTISKVEDIENKIKDIYTITLSTRKKIKYKPGQFLHLSLEQYDPSFPWPESRCFSFQSSPSDELLKITYSVKGAFTQRMSNTLSIGDEIWLKLPYGDLFQRGHSLDNCVFIAGGTGVSPFLSLFNSSEFVEYHNPRLYIGFRGKEYNLFENNFERAKNINDSLEINYFYESINGILDIDSILKENGPQTYFISGPPLMIKKFKNYLTESGVPENKILIDEWE